VGVLALLTGRWLLGLKRRTHIAAVSAISFTAMALGAAALVITLALLEGFQATIRRQLEDSDVHARLVPAAGEVLPGGGWIQRLRRDHPELEVDEESSTAVWCLAEGAAAPARLEAVEGLRTVEINRALAARLGVGIGATIQVASPRTVLTPLGPTPLRRQLEVGALLRSRPGDETAILRVPAATASAFVGSRGPQAVDLRARRPEDAWRVASIVQNDVPSGVHVVSFRDLNRPLLAALQLERVMIGFGVALVMVVAALNLLCNLALMAAEKRADVALLSAMGLTAGAVRRLFLALGAGVGVLGGVAGTGLGAAAAAVLDRTRALPLPHGVFLVSYVPFKVRFGAVLVVLGISTLSALAASLAPARAAARRGVVESLRYE
jgi:lipoprotein-releasing system permease protein